jgi:hypothetical protein
MVPCLRTINSSGTWCGNCYSIPRRSTTRIRWKALDFTTGRVLGLFSMLEELPAYGMLCATHMSDSPIRAS